MLQWVIKKTGTGADSSTQISAHSQPHKKSQGQKKTSEIQSEGQFSSAATRWAFSKVFSELCRWVNCPYISRILCFSRSLFPQLTGTAVWFLPALLLVSTLCRKLLASNYAVSFQIYDPSCKPITWRWHSPTRHPRWQLWLRKHFSP